MIAQSMAGAIRFCTRSAASDSSSPSVRRSAARSQRWATASSARSPAPANSTLVANEVAALERAYSDDEVRIRALLQDIAHQRDNLVGQAEQVRSAIPACRSTCAMISR